MVRDYKVGGSFNRDTGYGFYTMSEARGIVTLSYRIVRHDWKALIFHVLAYNSIHYGYKKLEGMMHLTLQQSD